MSSFRRASGPLEADRDGGGDEAEGDKGDKKDDVAQTEDTFGQLREVGHHPDHVDEFQDRPSDEPAALQIHQHFAEVRESAEPEDEANRHRDEEGDELAAGNRRDHRGHCEEAERHEVGRDEAGHDHSIVRLTEVVHRPDDREGKDQHREKHDRGREVFAEDGVPGRERHRQHQLHRAEALLLRPESHAHGRGDEDEIPGQVLEIGKGWDIGKYSGKVWEKGKGNREGFRDVFP